MQKDLIYMLDTKTDEKYCIYFYDDIDKLSMPRRFALISNYHALWIDTVVDENTEYVYLIVCNPFSIGERFKNEKEGLVKLSDIKDMVTALTPTAQFFFQDCRGGTILNEIISELW